jgi:prepilin-type N-terminal cleavage/methylation domain-containing protein
MMNLSPRKNNEGFTLAEVLVAFTILLILLGVLYLILHQGLKIYRHTEEKIDIQQNMRIGLDRIARDFRYSRGLVEKSGSVSLNEENLLLERNDGSIAWYYLSGTNLRLAVKKAGAAQFTGHNPLVMHIYSLQFIYHGRPISSSTLITINMEGKDTRGQSYCLTTSVNHRIR